MASTDSIWLVLILDCCQSEPVIWWWQDEELHHSYHGNARICWSRPTRWGLRAQSWDVMLTFSGRFQFHPLHHQQQQDHHVVMDSSAVKFPGYSGAHYDIGLIQAGIVLQNCSSQKISLWTKQRGDLMLTNFFEGIMPVIFLISWYFLKPQKWLPVTILPVTTSVRLLTMTAFTHSGWSGRRHHWCQAESQTTKTARSWLPLCGLLHAGLHIVISCCRVFIEILFKYWMLYMLDI